MLKSRSFRLLYGFFDGFSFDNNKNRKRLSIRFQVVDNEIGQFVLVSIKTTKSEAL